MRKIVSWGGLHYLAILPTERRKVFNFYNTSTSFNVQKTIGDYYE